MVKLPSNVESRNIWTGKISKARVISDEEGGEGKEGQSFVCSNHFVDGKLIRNNFHPTIFLTKMENKHRATAHTTSAMQDVYV